LKTKKTVRFSIPLIIGFISFGLVILSGIALVIRVGLIGGDFNRLMDFKTYLPFVIVGGIGMSVFIIVVIFTTIATFTGAFSALKKQTPSGERVSSTKLAAPYQSSEAIDDSPLKIPKQVEENSQIRLQEQAETYEVDWQKIAPLIYRGTLEEQTCGICKLILTKDDLVLQCPNCYTLFHDDHLIEWLSSKQHCPICKAQIDIK